MVVKEGNKRGIARLGIINVPYNKIAKVFGPPSLSEAAGDLFDGLESAAWIIKFESGHIAEITDVGRFGDRVDYKACNQWAIFGHDPVIMDVIKQYIK